MFHYNCEVMPGDDGWEQVDNYGGTVATEISLFLQENDGKENR